MRFLNGNATINFALKVLAVLVVFGVIFIYYFWDTYQKNNRKTKAVLDKKLAASYSVIFVLLLTIVLGLAVMDSPKISKQKRVDENTVFNLQNIDVAVRGYFNQTEGKLPTSLDELSQTSFAPAMEKNAAPITYKIRANNAYRLCANFLLSNKLYQDETGKYQTDAWKHNAGDMCFDRIALKSDNINTQTK